MIEVDRDRRKVVLSHRLATEEEREAQRQETLANLAEGQVRTGVVRRITDYGAFVDIGGVDGLLHISEMSWTRIKHPIGRAEGGRRDPGDGPEDQPGAGPHLAGPAADPAGPVDGGTRPLPAGRRHRRAR